MVVTIQFQSVEDLKWVEPLMQLLKKADVKVKFKGSSNVKRSSSKPDAKQQTTTTPITEQLQGILSLPNGFDYKDSWPMNS